MAQKATSDSDKKKWQRPGLGRALRWVVYLASLTWLYNNWHSSMPVSRLVEAWKTPESSFVRVDGMDVHCRIAGKGDPILLLHDANSSLHTWDGWTRALSDKYQVISVDLPGFGLTGPHPRGSYSAFMYAGFLDSLTQVLGLKKFHLAGNGLGAEIAWFYASEFPQKINRLVLLDAPGFGEEKNIRAVYWLARMPGLSRLLRRITPRDYIRLMLQDVYAHDALVNDSLVQRHFELLLRPGNRKAFIDRASVSGNRPPADIVEKIRVPTIIMWGAEDTRLSPEMAYLFHRKIKGAVLRIYQNTGHWPQEENPALTVQDVLAFLEGRF
jgi:pimeloyl-ACP methyl ester carboxylesterase